MKLEKVREIVHDRVLNLRNLENMIVQDDFEELWKESTEEQREEVIAFIVASKFEKVKKWMRLHPTIAPGEMSVRQLREKALEVGVKNVTRKSRGELTYEVLEILKKRKEVEKKLKGSK